ncbi:ABC transporter substrate-binding protein OS=Streptomyces glaucescens OX=1907 GN=SGLAU_08690 PE=4 SV=1 [Streptomyces glaucescens]
MVQAAVQDALTGRQTPEAAVRRLARELAAVSAR